jgi:subtilisin-like proprotein convertase family protein
MNMNVNDDFIISDIDVTVNCTHTWVSDLSLWLRSPSGDSVQLIASPEGTAPSGTDLTDTRFDDEASTAFAYSAGNSNYTGSWRPVGFLRDFDNISTQGQWNLIAADTDTGDVGTINNFTLHVRITPEQAIGGPSPSIPQSSAFHGCYPNPFNATTTLRFDLSKSGPVRLQLFNTLGQQMAMLVDGNLTAGSHQIIFDGSNFASGIYFALLQNGDFFETRKIVLLK